jgi:hypothetical protein
VSRAPPRLVSPSAPALQLRPRALLGDARRRVTSIEVGAATCMMQAPQGCGRHGHTVNRRMWEISENLHRAELTKLEHDEQVAEWVRISDKLSETRRGRPESGVSKASRELGLERMDASRAAKVDSLTPEAKDAAAVSLDFESYVCGSSAFSSRFVRRWWPWAPTFARLCRISPEVRDSPRVQLKGWHSPDDPAPDAPLGHRRGRRTSMPPKPYREQISWRRYGYRQIR